MKIKIICILSFIVIVFVAVFYSPLCNEKRDFVSIVKFLDGSIVEINESHSDASYIGFPILFSISIGLDSSDKYQWMKNNKHHSFKTKFIPIIYAEFDLNQYVVVFDRESNSSESIFRFYKGNESKWEEIDYKEFPKHLAVQNAWLNIGENGFSLPEFKRQLPRQIHTKLSQILLNPPEQFDLNSEGLYLTKKLWLLLDKGQQYYVSKEFPESFYTEFIIKNNVKPIK